MALCLRMWVFLKWESGSWVLLIFGFQQSRMACRAEQVDMGVLVMEILVGEVKVVGVVMAVTVTVKITCPYYLGNVALSKILSYPVSFFL